MGVPQRVSVDALIGRQPGLEPQAREQMADVGSGELRAVERAEHVPPADETELAPALEPQLAPGGAAGLSRALAQGQAIVALSRRWSRQTQLDL